MTNLNDFLASCSQRVETFFDQVLPQTSDEPIALHEAIRYSAMNGGKRIRPALVYATGIALEIELDNLDTVAGAIELMHSYSLIHDDLPAMDNDDLRRGKPTCHKAFDEATAILAGDAMQALAFELLTSNEHKGPDKAIRAELTHILATSVGPMGMAGGQAMDLAAVDKQLSIETLELIHRKKTGCLIQACINMTQSCKDKLSKEERTKLLDFGHHLGLAFQIRDDILDETSDTETLGKPQGSDRELNKPTYVSLLGVETSEQLCNKLFAQAESCLDNFNHQANMLRLLAEHIVCRTH